MELLLHIFSLFKNVMHLCKKYVYYMYNVMYMPHGPVDISFTQVWAPCQSLGGDCRTKWERSAKWKGAIDEGCGYKTGEVQDSESRVLRAHQEVPCETCRGKPLTLRSFCPSCFC